MLYADMQLVKQALGIGTIKDDLSEVRKRIRQEAFKRVERYRNKQR